MAGDSSHAAGTWDVCSSFSLLSQCLVLFLSANSLPHIPVILVVAASGDIVKLFQ